MNVEEQAERENGCGRYLDTRRKAELTAVKWDLTESLCTKRERDGMWWFNSSWLAIDLPI